jgi:hypothetical protein
MLLNKLINLNSMAYYFIRTFIFLIVASQLGLTTIFAQQVEYLNGKILDSKTFEPVPYATVLLKNHQAGVFANTDGDFRIINNQGFNSDSLIITCIGFNRLSVAFKNLNLSGVNSILLIRNIYGLGEIRVIAKKRKLSSVAIVSRAIRNIKNNYPKTPFNFVSYYRDYQKNGNDYLNLNEAIVQTLDNGFVTESVSNRYRLLDYKKNMDFPRMNISPFYNNPESQYPVSSVKTIPKAILGDQYGNELFILLVHDAIRNFNIKSFSFVDTLSQSFINNHQFSDPVGIYNGNVLLYKINFTAKRQITGDTLIVNGAIFIQPKDYSVHKLEYSCSFLNSEKQKQEIYSIEIEYGHESSLDSLMCLKYISFNNLFIVPDSTDNDFFKIVDSYWESANPYRDNYFPDLTFVTVFSKKIDPSSGIRKSNYVIKIGNKNAKINKIKVDGAKLYITVKDDNFVKVLDSSKIDIQNLKDINGNLLNRRKSIQLHQFRELFVQEYNKPLDFQDSCFMQYMPLDQNCISRSNSVSRFWMNTPAKTKSEKPLLYDP